MRSLRAVLCLLPLAAAAQAAEFEVVDRLKAPAGIEVSTHPSGAAVLSVSPTVMPGNVGVGVTDPGERLDVGGPLVLRSTAAPALSSAGQAKLYLDNAGNRLKLTQNAKLPAMLGASIVYPDGITGWTPVTVNSGWPYTVPAGKNLYITNIYFESAGSGSEYNMNIAGIAVATIRYTANNYRGGWNTAVSNYYTGWSDGSANCLVLGQPLIAGAGQAVNFGGGQYSFNGFLVDAKVTPVTASVAYTVPAGNTFVMLNFWWDCAGNTGEYTMTIAGKTMSVTRYSNNNARGGFNVPLIGTSNAGTDAVSLVQGMPMFLAAGEQITTNGCGGSVNGYLLPTPH